MEYSFIFLICCLFFIVAFLYSTVGHGGASGYLAVLSLFAFVPNEMASTALLLNILVAGIAFVIYLRAGFFSSRLTFPFLLSSIPLAFIGGMIHLSHIVYSILLAIALIVAAFRLMLRFDNGKYPQENVLPPKLSIALPTGGAIGFISGIVGVGGGIFLSPLILLKKWADPKHTSATAALFIVLNSISGILGRVLQGNFSTGTFFPFLLTAVAGGFVGSWWGARKFSGLTLRRLLGIVLLIAAAKLIINML